MSIKIDRARNSLKMALMQQDLGGLLKLLRDLDCYPSIYRKGKKWRAHVNFAGNFWNDGSTPEIALREAIRLWFRCGMRMDGAASGTDGKD